MKNYIYVQDIWLKEKKWIPISDIASGLTYFGSDYCGYVIKLDDPSITTAQKTRISVEADNYRPMTPDDLIPYKDVYSLRDDGSMRWDYTVIKSGILSVEILNVDYNDTEKVDITWALNYHYVKK